MKTLDLSNDELQTLREALEELEERLVRRRGQMAKRGVAVPDVKKAIRTATGAVQQDNGSWRITGGKDTEGDDLVLAVSVVDERITLITPLDSNGE